MAQKPSEGYCKLLNPSVQPHHAHIPYEMLFGVHLWHATVRGGGMQSRNAFRTTPAHRSTTRKHAAITSRCRRPIGWLAEQSDSPRLGERVNTSSDCCRTAGSRLRISDTCWGKKGGQKNAATKKRWSPGRQCNFARHQKVS